MQELKLIKKKRGKILILIKEIENTNDKELKYLIYKDILKIDNTDRNIVRQYLLLMKEIRKTIDKDQNLIEEINTYINHFPPKEFNKDFAEFCEKETSSMSKILIILEKILSQDWINANYEEKKSAISFFYNVIKEGKLIIKNTSPITWENDELYIYNLYSQFLFQINGKMEHYQSQNTIDGIEIKSDKIIKCDERIKKMEDYLKEKKHLNFFIEDTKKLIEKEKENRKLLVLIEGNFFKKYLTKFNDFLTGIKDTYIKELSTMIFKDEKNKNVFEYFMLFISHYNFENITTMKCLVWESSFVNSDKDKVQKLIEQYKQKKRPMEISVEKDNKLRIKGKNMKEIIIENYDDYELENLLSDIYDNHQFNEVKAIKYVKITKMDNHLYIKKIYAKWIKFIISLFYSNTITSLYVTLFKQQEQFITDVEEMNIILNNITFYAFDTDFAGQTDRESLKIYEYSNYDNLIDTYDKNLSNEDVLKVVFLAFNLVVNFHELLGHFNIGYQSYNYSEENKEKYDSPKVKKELSSDFAKKRNGQESGENIEINLLGRVINELTLKEALFLLNPKNYRDNDYSSFREKFMKCNDSGIDIDEHFHGILLNIFKINPENLKNAENRKYSLNDLIKKSPNDNQKYIMKRKHSVNFKIDGLTKEDYEKIEKIIEIIKNLDTPITNDQNCNNQ